MISSCRPNKRASSENMPGPNSAIATAITTTSKDASPPAFNVPSGNGNQENTFARIINVTNKLTMGVRNPITKHIPHTASTTHAVKFTRRPPCIRHCKPCATAMAPTARRIKRSAVPGLPLGNVEKNRCSAVLPEPVLIETSIQGYMPAGRGYTRHPGIFSSPFRGMGTVRHLSIILSLKLNDAAADADGYGLRAVACA